MNSSTAPSTKKRVLPGWASVVNQEVNAAAGTANLELQQQILGKKNRLKNPEKKEARESGKDATTVKKNDEIDQVNVSTGSRSEDGEPPARSFSRLMERVVFSISGLVNPERSELREKALTMGAEYRPRWSSDCTLLICGLANTPTFNQVQAVNGTIVAKEWVIECYEKKMLVGMEEYLMHVGNPWRASCIVRDPPDFGTSDTYLSGKFAGRGSSTTQPKLLGTGRPDANKKKPAMGTIDINPICKGEAARKMVAATIGEVRNWAEQDVAAITTWLEHQSEKPDPADLEAVALQGLSACLEDCLKSLRESSGLKKVFDSWQFIPRAVRELAMLEKIGEECCQGHCIKDELLKEAEKIMSIYEAQLRKIKIEGKMRLEKKENLESDCYDEDGDDSETDIISDADSRDTRDYDSDETQVLTPAEVYSCKEKILSKLELHIT